MIEVEEFLFFVDRALDGMAAIVTDLGDDLANTAPPAPGANSPYVTLTHCLGVVEFWAGHVMAGRPVARDRDAEFRAAGPVPALLSRAAAVRHQLRADLDRLDASAPPRNPLGGYGAGERPNLSQGGGLLHVLEELAQHHGQMEVGRDLLLARAGR